MTRSKKIIVLMFLFVLLLTGCDPGHSAKSYIRNESAYKLELKYVLGGLDSSHQTMTIEPYSYVHVDDFGGIGSGRDFNCCLCDFRNVELQPTDTSRKNIKDINKDENWTMDNPNVGKSKFSSKKIACEFVVTPSDIK